jgi:NitT/TauT family transport system ATP-binding protein
MTAIVLDKVWKEYGDRVVLERIDLTIAPRAFVAIVGPSGCGKTTLLRMLLGDEVPSRGTIRVNGRPLQSEPNADRGVVFQRYSVFPHLTVLDNVRLGRDFEQARYSGRLWGRKRRAVTDEAMTLLGEVGLTGEEHKYPAALSGGMQQRLALAQALILKPKILLLDEPFGALDPGMRADIHVLIRRLWNENDLTVLMVTHDLSEAFRLATRVIALERRRNRPEEQERFGTSLSGDMADTAQQGAMITTDHEVWPRKIAGAQTAHARSLP